jgi:hypothetical protein
MLHQPTAVSDGCQLSAAVGERQLAFVIGSAAVGANRAEVSVWFCRCAPCVHVWPFSST